MNEHEAKMTATDPDEVRRELEALDAPEVSPSHSGIGGGQFPRLPLDTARRRHIAAAARAVRAEVPLAELVADLIMAVKGYSLPGERDYRLAREIADQIRGT